MTGYCETCTQEVDSVRDEQDGDVCPQCGDDVHPGFHVDDEEYDEDEAEFEFSSWLIG